jgi:beta-galactosidase GanA
MAAVLATPSGARPAWMSAKYPEVLRVGADRRRILHGGRHNHCYTSPVYREKTAQINTLLAERYKDHPALAIWHLSNEYGGECHCELCQEAFREWLKMRYGGSLNELNHSWWAAFWSHTYTDWLQVVSPSPIGESSVHGLTLDWKRFVTEQTIDFMKAEMAPLRRITPDVPCTTNMMGFYDGLNYYRLSEEIDVASWDSYPIWRADGGGVNDGIGSGGGNGGGNGGSGNGGGSNSGRGSGNEGGNDGGNGGDNGNGNDGGNGGGNSGGGDGGEGNNGVSGVSGVSGASGIGSDARLAAFVSMTHDVNRCLKDGRPFMLMESCPSATNWQPIGKLKRPGVLELQSLQAIAHGSDTIQYFQYRKSRGSSEKFHGAVVDHEGTENTRVFREIAETGATLEKIGAVAGTAKPAEVAIIYDVENRWALDASVGFTQNKKYVETLAEHYAPFWKAGVSVDMIDSTKDISGYKLVVAPMLYMLRPGMAEKIEKFVQSGGAFVATYMTGYVDEHDLCFPGGFPGPLKNVLGVWCEEIDALFDGERRRISWNGKVYEARELCEIAHLIGAGAGGNNGGEINSCAGGNNSGEINSCAGGNNSGEINSCVSGYNSGSSICSTYCHFNIIFGIIVCYFCTS